jgi:transcriptional regulator with XRE-family HTH domain
MQMVDDEIEVRMAARLRARRQELGLSLGELAARSGVSKAMIAKIEHGASSPTAGLLGRLCGGLEITMSALMAAVESEDAGLAVAADQPRWRDRESGLERVAVSPPTSFGAVEVARLSLPADTVIDYPTPPGVAYGQHILGVEGTLRFTLGRRSFEIGPGDCVAARIDRPTRFEVVGPQAAEYLVIIERAGA